MFNESGFVGIGIGDASSVIAENPNDERMASLQLEARASSVMGRMKWRTKIDHVDGRLHSVDGSCACWPFGSLSSKPRLMVYTMKSGGRFGDFWNPRHHI